MTPRHSFLTLAALFCIASTCQVRSEEVVELRFHKIVDKASDTTTTVPGRKEGDNPVIVENPALLSESDIESAFTSESMSVYEGKVTVRANVSLKFSESGSKKFAKVTESLIGHRLAILANGKLLMSPNINEPITGGSAAISGPFTKEEATQLADAINRSIKASQKKSP